MDADDSDFYGKPEERQLLQARVDRFDACAWAKQHGVWAFGSPRPSGLVKSSKLHNPYAGVDCARQLSETVDDFLLRLPPATTEQSEDTPWIFICNPYVSQREKQDDNGGEFMRGNEHEAPAEEGSQLGRVVQGGMERLELLADLRQNLESSGKSAVFVKKELLQEQKQAVVDILRLAHVGKVRSGKWMLFCPSLEVNQVWGLVAKATAENKLGVAAKVNPRARSDDARKDRLICIYTADFQDKSDVGRVLQHLTSLKLVGSRRPTIYYKPDIFTYLGISHGNIWGLAASIYNSKTFR
ncbi:DNA polymerase II large subunit-like protein [Metarhizium rileyi]|uniref:DNA polymerase II large subunit-like protein n=1 Tax=Metarhizium rileyi (strain RCEF 4871) TaxID=1649241 RepID=A0A167IX09_METRR|nr:DNA polymerase II large subunit-like protein [Metarhizium rileyi RCEF 4871]